VKENILAKQAKITENERPKTWSPEAADFINSLLQRKHANRLGHDKPGSAKLHPWFKDFDWQKLEKFEIPSPFYGIVNIKNLTV
jgi:hypothetical protein